MKTLSSVPFFFLTLAVPAFANVVVSTPSNGETVGATVSYSATATTSTCARGVASMGVYIDSQLLFVVNGDDLKTTLSVTPGEHNTVIEEWDYCGDATFVSMKITSTSQVGIHVTSPANGSTVSSPANYVATATSACPKGVASMGIYVNNQLMVVQNGAKLNTQVNLGPGAQHTVVEEWDECGGSSYTTINVTAQGNDMVLSNLQASAGWNGWGELTPSYNICTAPCSGVTWSMSQHVKSPSLSGNATQFNVGGTAPYSDVLWSIPLLGQGTTQDIPDTGHTLIQNVHNFTYDAYFYGSNLGLTQVLEFDVSMYMKGLGFIWGTQCRIAGGNEWDTWDDPTSKWVPTGIACKPGNNEWNHVTIHMQRKEDNTLLYESISLNGVTSNINKTSPPFSVPSGWWGVTANYQMDGNSKQSANSTYLDNFNITYW